MCHQGTTLFKLWLLLCLGRPWITCMSELSCKHGRSHQVLSEVHNWSTWGHATTLNKKTRAEEQNSDEISPSLALRVCRKKRVRVFWCIAFGGFCWEYSGGSSWPLFSVTKKKIYLANPARQSGGSKANICQISVFPPPRMALTSQMILQLQKSLANLVWWTLGLLT